MKSINEILETGLQSRIRAFEIELSNGEYEFLELYTIDNKKLACNGCNVGVIAIDYDFDFSLDLNIQALYDEVINRLTELNLI